MEEKIKNNHIKINTGKLIFSIMIFCLIAEIILVLFDIIFSFFKVLPVDFIETLFYLGTEQSCGTYFSTLQTFLSGITLLIIFFVVKYEKRKKTEQIIWLFLSIFFIYMSFDDALMVHENMPSIFEYFFININSNNYLLAKLKAFYNSFPSYHWQLIIAPFFIIAGIVIFYFLWKRYGELRLRPYLFTGLFCFLIAIIMDFGEGLNRPGLLLFIRDSFGLYNDTVLHFSKTIEEYLEMLGNTLLWYSFLHYLAVICDRMEIFLTITNE